MTDEELRAHSENYQIQTAKVENAVNSFGTSVDLFKERTIGTTESAASFCGDVMKAAIAQSLHDQFVNLPTSILEHRDYTCERPVKMAIVHAIGKFIEWDINQAIKFAADILEDVNAHEHAATVREMLKHS